MSKRWTYTMLRGRSYRYRGRTPAGDFALEVQAHDEGWFDCPNISVSAGIAKQIKFNDAAKRTQ